MIPVNPPVLPMLAKRVAALPEGEGWIFEPKWDGFRALVFRDGDELSDPEPRRKAARPLLPGAGRAAEGGSCPSAACSTARSSSRSGTGLDFEALQLRIHPAASRVKLLAEQIPASIVFFDLLCDGDRDLRGAPFRERRALLEALLADAGRRSTSRPPPPIGRWRPTGSSASRAPASTA